MQSTARVLDHPLHPILIPYPFAFLSGATAFDAAAVANGDKRYAQTAKHLSNAGIGMALAAAVPGLIDYLTVVPEGESKRTATRHMLTNLSALGCFAAAASVRGNDSRPSTAVLALELVGTALLSLGGWLGGELVYHKQIGVEPEEPHHELQPQGEVFGETSAGA
jgi:uncharacterized membrane protein